MPGDLQQGAIIGGRYRLDHLLGEGGMGAVWAATHLVTRKHVALKFLKAAGAQRPDTVRRFLREARAASAVNHPNVVQIHDIMEADDGLPVMIMDLLVGESLGDKLDREGRVAARELARILVPVISAVGTAHALGIVHRDLKPDNIFLVKLPDGRVDPKVLDFGIAKLTAEEGDAAKTAGLTQTGSMLGTPYYMAPEQAFGEKSLDQRADVWAMGVILYQCLSGKRPVSGENLGQLFRVLMSGEIVPLREAAPDVPDDLCALVDRMLATDRARRLPDLREALAVLRRYTDVAGQSFDAPAAPLMEDAAPAQTGADREAPSRKASSLASAPTAEAPAMTGQGATGVGGTVVMAPSGVAQASTAAPLSAAASTAAPPSAQAATPKRSGAMVTAGVIAALLVVGAVAGLSMSLGGADATPEDTAPSAAQSEQIEATAPAPTVTPAPPVTAADTAAAASAAPAASSASAAPIAGRPPAGRPTGATTGTVTPASTPATAKPSSTALPGGVVGDVPF